jgi:hypothetical protein
MLNSETPQFGLMCSQQADGCVAIHAAGISRFGREIRGETPELASSGQTPRTLFSFFAVRPLSRGGDAGIVTFTPPYRRQVTSTGGNRPR